MSKFLYILIVKIYFFFIGIASLFNEKAKLFTIGRKNIFQKIERDINKNGGTYVWFHCASLGEFEQGRPVIEGFKKVFPQVKVLLTFFSPSGYEVRKNYPFADLIYYLPADTSKNASRFLNIVNPVLAVFIKYEFWHFYIKELKSRNIPLLSVSSIFRSDQIFFKSYGTFYRNTLKLVNHFFVQNTASAELLNTIDIYQVTVSGDTRFDRVKEIAFTKKDLPIIEEFLRKSDSVVAGSTWKEDIEVLAPTAKDFPNIKFIVAPHEIDEGTIKVLQNNFPNSCRHSKGVDMAKQVLIIDNIGLLSSLYQYGTYAYVGGAFGKGLHNILEAATYGVPVFFGNLNYKKFNEAVELEVLGGAFSLSDSVGLTKHLTFFEKNPEVRETVGYINKKYVKDHVGATNVILDYCKELMNDKI